MRMALPNIQHRNRNNGLPSLLVTKTVTGKKKRERINMDDQELRERLQELKEKTDTLQESIDYLVFLIKPEQKAMETPTEEQNEPTKTIEPEQPRNTFKIKRKK